MSNLITFDQFRDKWLGKKCDYDGFYGGQCVDLYRQYVKEVLGVPQSPGVGGATEIWYTASDEYYDFIENTIEAIPVPGDIPIWKRNVGGGFGHVDIVLSASQAMFTGLDQNWPTLDKVTKTKHNYDNIIGWLHPKGKNMTNMYGDPALDLDNPETMKITVDVYNDVRHHGKYVTIEEHERKMAELQKKIDNHKCPIITPKEAEKELILSERVEESVENNVKIIKKYTIDR